MQVLDHQIKFPLPCQTDAQGLLAIGGDLSIPSLLLAYRSGIFPWYEDGEPILWWSPNPRMVLFPHKLHVSKSMKQLFKKEAFQVTYNQYFEEVIRNCSEINRAGQYGTWITEEMIAAYVNLHKDGYAKSVEVWQGDLLVGGLYGIYLKEEKIFCGESMFAKTSNASKYGFISWVKKLEEEGVKLIDCQVHTKHLESLGAQEIDREVFLSYLNTDF
jgi:leucyl/phenylalanyl-tRNA--protein transferase